MMLCLTSEKNGFPVVLRADCVLFARLDPETKLATDVVTNIMGPQGLQAFRVKEKPEQVALMVNAWLAAQLHNQTAVPDADRIGLGNASRALLQS